MKNITFTPATKTLLGLSLVSVLSGCGAFGTKENGKKSQENNQKLTGEWKSNCSAFGWLGLTHKTDTLTFGALGDFDGATTAFVDDACSTPVTTLTQHGTYASLDASKSVEGATNINFTITSAAITAQSDDAAKMLNAASYCGITAWANGKAIDVMDKPCLGATHPSGEVLFDIYELSNGDDLLNFGKGSLFLDQDDANSRPTTLDESRAFIRQ
jgi:hypothetical protein